MYLIRLPRSLPRHAARVATVALMAVLLAVALAGCRAPDLGALQRAVEWRMAAEALCRDMGGKVYGGETDSWVDSGGARSEILCSFAAPAEAPEGGAP